ncbi:MaoC/PaaZ C-terminal domain-containing protein [Streptomyces sp. NPDC051132]|uniref:MaoC family dehydratase n=1 Tax=unclassified Streptomyces TaxID=2593676 RepID=UPI00342CF5FD
MTQPDTAPVPPVPPGAFDPDAFLVVPARTFEDLRVGEVFRAPSRTLTDAHAAAFQTVSADNHPVHYDAEWARRHGHRAPVVHGLPVAATLHNQRGELVLSGEHTYLLRRR